MPDSVKELAGRMKEHACHCCQEIPIDQIYSDLRETLAILVHEQWTAWLLYLMSNCVVTEDADHAIAIPNSVMERWGRRMRTPYNRLSESEKESDRKEADRVITVLREKGLL